MQPPTHGATLMAQHVATRTRNVIPFLESVYARMASDIHLVLGVARFRPAANPCKRIAAKTMNAAVEIANTASFAVLILVNLVPGISCAAGMISAEVIANAIAVWVLVNLARIRTNAAATISAE